LPVPITDDSDFTGVKRRFMEVIFTKTRFPNTYRDNVELVVVAKDVRTYVTWYCSVEPVDYSSLTILVNLIIWGSVFACWVGVSSVSSFKSKKSRQ
jgi:sensor histidine kinase YesM